MTIETLISLVVALVVIAAINFFILKKDIKTVIVATISGFIGLVIAYFLTGRIHF